VQHSQAIVKMSISHNLIKALALLCFVGAYANTLYANTDAGQIGMIKGSGVLERGRNVVNGVTGVGVQSMDVAVTARGQMQIDFVDETRVDLTEHTRLLIDEFVYDPQNDIGKLSIKATLGSVRYASGQIAKKYKQNVSIKTPSATIGVRGTDFVLVVDELGGSMITLLPSCDVTGLCYVGEIDVMTDAGTVVMNQAFQSTITRHAMQPPTPPLIIDIEERFINQLLILRKKTPYDEEETEIRRKARAMFDFLGLDMLEFDSLDGDALKDSIEGIWKTQLDETNHMLADMLYDMLDKLNEALFALFKDELTLSNSALLQSVEVSKYGFDPDTGIRFDVLDPNYVWIRQDFDYGNYIKLELNQAYNYSLDVEQGDFTLYDFRIGNEGGNHISIIQSN